MHSSSWVPAPFSFVSDAWPRLWSGLPAVTADGDISERISWAAPAGNGGKAQWAKGAPSVTRGVGLGACGRSVVRTGSSTIALRPQSAVSGSAAGPRLASQGYSCWPPLNRREEEAPTPSRARMNPLDSACALLATAHLHATSLVARLLPDSHDPKSHHHNHHHGQQHHQPLTHSPTLQPEPPSLQLVLPFASVTGSSPSYPSSFTTSSPTAPASSTLSLSATSTATTTTATAAAAAAAKAEVGRATWTLLHTLAAQFPQRPSRQQQRDARALVDCLTRIYPCGDCAQHFAELVRRDPPVVSSGPAFRRWLCGIHNRVNARLGKSVFNCDLVEGRWAPLGCSAEEEAAGEPGGRTAGCELMGVGSKAAGTRRRG